MLLKQQNNETAVIVKIPERCVITHFSGADNPMKKEKFRSACASCAPKIKTENYALLKAQRLEI